MLLLLISYYNISHIFWGSELNFILSETIIYSTVTIVVDGVYCLIFTDEKYDFIWFLVF
jgi:hypothetical protein